MDIYEEAKEIVNLHAEIARKQEVLENAQQEYYEAQHNLAITPIEMSIDLARGIVTGFEYACSLDKRNN